MSVMRASICNTCNKTFTECGESGAFGTCSKYEGTKINNAHGYFMHAPDIGTEDTVKVLELEAVVHDWINSEPKSSHNCAADIMNVISKAAKK